MNKNKTSLRSYRVKKTHNNKASGASVNGIEQELTLQNQILKKINLNPIHQKQLTIKLLKLKQLVEYLIRQPPPDQYPIKQEELLADQQQLSLLVNKLTPQLPRLEIIFDSREEAKQILQELPPTLSPLLLQLRDGLQSLEQNLQDLEPTKQVSNQLLMPLLTQVYLSDVELSDANLSGKYLSDVYLSGKDLSGKDLSGADLSNANLSNTNLSNANLTSADLTDAYLSNTNLSNANLTSADLTDAYLSNANLLNANLTDANLAGANLIGVTSFDYNISVTCPSLEDFQGKDFSKVYDTPPPSFKCVNLKDANFQAIFNSPADFRGADLTNANFQQAIFNSSPNFIGANLTGANFQSAMLNKPIFIGANLTDANFQSAMLKKPIFYRTNFTNTGFQNSELFKPNICPPGANCI